MELTVEQLEIIKESSKEISYGRIVIDFTGPPSFVVDITAEKKHRFQRYKQPVPTTTKPAKKRISGTFRND